MEDQLIEILSSFKYPVFRQGSMSNETKYPDTFFTFWNNDSPDHSHYNNDCYGTAWDFEINVYSNDPSTTYSLLAMARVALKQAGWIVTSQGYDIASDEASHTGRGLQAFYLQTKQISSKEG